MDMKIPMACVLMAGGALGLFLPGDERAEQVEQPSTSAAMARAQAPVLAAAQAADAQAWGEQVTLYRENDGHFYAEIGVDGQFYRMLVDTGASVVALTGEDAARMGIQWDPADLAPIARGAGGPIEGVAVTIDRMSLGGIEAGQVRAIIIPEGAGVSLLGQSFLGTIGKVEIAGDRMVMGN